MNTFAQGRSTNMKIKSLALFAVIGLLFMLTSQAQTYPYIPPVPPIIGPQNDAQVVNAINVLLGSPGTFSGPVNQWMDWLMAGNPWTVPPAQNVIPADLSIALNKYYVTNLPLTDAEWDLVNAFEHFAAYVNYPVFNVYGFFGTGDIPDLDTFLSMGEDEDAATDNSTNYIALSTYQMMGNQVEY